jgi:hypothetical protein
MKIVHNTSDFSHKLDQKFQGKLKRPTLKTFWSNIARRIVEQIYTIQVFLKLNLNTGYYISIQARGLAISIWHRKIIIFLGHSSKSSNFIPWERVSSSLCFEHPSVLSWVPEDHLDKLTRRSVDWPAQPDTAQLPLLDVCWLDTFAWHFH